MREKQYGDSIPGKPPPCPDPPERVALDARDDWACVVCNHVLSPVEAQRRGLTAEGEDGARVSYPGGHAASASEGGRK